jgi:hypothetical protein
MRSRAFPSTILTRESRLAIFGDMKPHLVIDPVERQGWLDEILTLKQAAEARGVCIDTIKREAQRGRLELIRVSERRLGVRRRDALQLSA